MTLSDAAITVLTVLWIETVLMLLYYGIKWLTAMRDALLTLASISENHETTPADRGLHFKSAAVKTGNRQLRRSHTLIGL